MHEVVELRCDTFSLPTPAMREAMARAQVGDDGWGEDPTIQRLEAMAADIVGMEAALFVSSGTQGNLVAVMAHTQPGQEIILDADSHIFNLEAGGVARLAGLQTNALQSPGGFLTPDQVRSAIRPSKNINVAITGLVCMENTNNRRGGTYCSVDHIAGVADAAHCAGVPVHLDGARIFNAAVELGQSVRDFARPVDSLVFCLSKGLAAPVGSLLCGHRDFVARSRRIRKTLGGGMRQAGVLAAAGIVALETMATRLLEDHINARTLAAGLAQIPGIHLNPETVQTNIVLFNVNRAEHAEDLVCACKKQKVNAHRVWTTAIRCVTHKDVDSEDVQRAVQVIQGIAGGW